MINEIKEIIQDLQEQLEEVQQELEELKDNETNKQLSESEEETLISFNVEGQTEFLSKNEAFKLFDSLKENYSEYFKVLDCSIKDVKD